MSNSYILVNPHVEGSLKKQIKAKNSLEAAKSLYKNLSEHFNNSIPKFYFTIQKGGSGKGKYYSFKVKESRDDNTVDFSLEPIVIQNESTVYSKFNKNLEKVKKVNEQNGGAKKKSKKKSSSKSKKSRKDPFDDEDDMDEFLNSDDNQKYYSSSYSQPFAPIQYYYYDPYLYGMNMSSFYIPTFYSYVNPFIKINFYPA